jgi:mannose-6-phosphate isomerase-like protein (cupin superfamily)
MRISNLVRPKTSKPCASKDLTKRCRFDHSAGSRPAAGGSLPRRVSLVSLVTAMTFIDTNRLNLEEPRAGWKGRFFHSQNMTFAYYAVAAGAWIHEHSHPNDEVWNVIDGELEIKIAAETQVAGPGCAVVVPPDTAHSVKALTDVRAIVVD